MLKMHFYSPLPMSLTETLSNPLILMLYNTFPYLHTIPVSQQMPNVLLNLPRVNFLPNLHKIHDVLIYVISQGQGWCKI